MDQLYTTSQVSNITRKTKISPNFLKKCKNTKLSTPKAALILL